jgi:ribosome-associated protein
MVRTLKSHQEQRAREEEDTRDLTSRTDKRKILKERESALTDLARRLVTLKDKRLRELELSDPLYDAITAAQVIDSPGALNRQLRRIRFELRDMDADALLQKLVDRDEGRVLAPAAQQAEEWLTRLLAEGDSALDALLSERPALDRQKLRQLLRSYPKATAGEQPRLRKRLLTELRTV